VNLVLAGGMGSRAQALFEEAGIQVVTGVLSIPADEVVQAYLNGTLTTGANACDH
jgi:predicted Fe-Mo cluster-binding NifX family protein